MHTRISKDAGAEPVISFIKAIAKIANGKKRQCFAGFLLSFSVGGCKSYPRLRRTLSGKRAISPVLTISGIQSVHHIHKVKIRTIAIPTTLAKIEESIFNLDCHDPSPSDGLNSSMTNTSSLIPHPSSFMRSAYTPRYCGGSIVAICTMI